MIREAGQLPLWADSPLKDTDFRISQGGILIGRNQVLVRDAVIVEKNEKLRGRVCGSTISIGGRASPWSLDHLHAGQFPSQHLPGLQRVSVIADDEDRVSFGLPGQAVGKGRERPFVIAADSRGQYGLSAPLLHVTFLKTHRWRCLR